MPQVTVSVITTPQQMQQALEVRRRVFIEEQQVPEEEEIDEHDLPKAWGRTAVHVVGRLHGRSVATARLILDTEPGALPHIGRVSVLRDFRSLGYGRTIMVALHEEARERGFTGVTLAAQLHAIPFYERLGYVARGPVFLDAGIEHRDMDLRWS